MNLGGNPVVSTSMKLEAITSTSQTVLPDAKRWAGWQASCFVTMAAVLAALLYFGGNVIGYGAPPQLILPLSISSIDHSKPPPPVLTIRVASMAGNVSDAQVGDFVWFVSGRINPLDEAGLRGVLRDYALDVNASTRREGLDPSTGLSSNLVRFEIDARCPAENYLRLLQIARECGLWKLYFSVRCITVL
jgi:hypothetical protein